MAIEEHEFIGIELKNATEVLMLARSDWRLTYLACHKRLYNWDLSWIYFGIGEQKQIYHRTGTVVGSPLAIFHMSGWKIPH